MDKVFFLWGMGTRWHDKGPCDIYDTWKLCGKGPFMRNISEIYGFHKMHFHQLFEDLPAHGFQNFLYQNKFIFQFHFLWTLGGALINVYVHLFIFLRSLMILVHMFLFQLIFVIGYCSAIPSLQVSLLRSRTPTRLEVTRM